MREVAKILGRLIALLFIKGIINKKDKDFICGEITETEWMKEEA